METTSISYQHLLGHLLTARQSQKAINSIRGGIVLIMLYLLLKLALNQAAWMDIGVVLILIGPWVHTGILRRYLVGVWGRPILDAEWDDAKEMLSKAMINLTKRGW